MGKKQNSLLTNLSFVLTNKQTKILKGPWRKKVNFKNKLLANRLASTREKPISQNTFVKLSSFCLQLQLQLQVNTSIRLQL
jgi:hypothetical protein